MENLQITREDIRKEQLQVNQYFKKESFLLKNLKNEKYNCIIDVYQNVYVIKYKKVNKKNYKKFVLVKEFFTFKREYKITEKTQNLINELIEIIKKGDKNK